MPVSDNEQVQTSPVERPDLSCSQWSLDLAEPLAGTASTTRGYLAIEQSGAWGRNALAESAVDSEVAAELQSRLDAQGLSALLIRRPGRSPDRTHQQGHQVFAAVLGESPVTVSFRVASVQDLVELDWTHFQAATLTALHPEAAEITAPVALVCAHAKRDRCCALRGRALASDLAQRLPAGTTRAVADRHGTGPGTSSSTSPDSTGYEVIWECSHLGGHRLAPTAVLLPAGAVYGRLDGPGLTAAYRAAESGQVLAPLLRGMARYARPLQTAEIAVRTAAGIDDASFPVLAEQESDGPDTTAVFRDDQDRHWRVRIREQPVRDPRPESCGKAPARPTACTIEEISQVTRPRIGS